MRQSFEFCDMDGSGMIDNRELDKLLRNLGLDPNTDMQKEAIADCLANPEFSGDLDFPRVLKLAMMYHDAVTAKVFQFASSIAGRVSVVIPVAHFKEALRRAGIHITEEKTQTLAMQAYVELSSDDGALPEDVTESNINIDVLRRMLVIRRRESLQEWRRTYGFDEREVEEVRKACFAHSQGHPKGAVPLQGIFQVLKTLQKQPANDAQSKSLALALMRVDRADQNWIPVEEVLLIIRHLDYLDLKIRAADLLNHRNGKELASEDLDQLKEVFANHDQEGRGKLQAKVIFLIFAKLGLATDIEQK